MKRAIVVGSGAGGAAAALELQKSFEVTVLEAGAPFAPFSRNLDRLERLRASRLFFDARMIRGLFPPMHVAKVADQMVLVWGVATGGSTTLATGNALRVDGALRERGIDLDVEFNELQAELPITTDHRDRWRKASRDLYATCKSMGLQPTPTPKMVDYSRCQRCGRCVLGCPNNAKWDSRVFLDASLSAGGTLISGTHVERVALHDGRALGVIVRSRGGHELIAADLVVLAAGGLGTPALLERSGIRTDSSLFVDPVLCVAAPSEGAYQNRDIPMPFMVEREGYIVSPYFDYLSFFFNRHWRRPGADILGLMIKLADSGVGTYDHHGIRKGLTAADQARLREATDLCTQVLVEAGVARASIFRGTINGGHPGGTLALTGREQSSLHPDRLPANLYVADASLLPESLGKPAILTIMALARRVARVCAQRLA